MARIPVQIIDPQQLEGSGEVPGFPIEQFPRSCLAQGDSWFSIGAIPPFLTTNLLRELELSTGTCIVQCASPGATLKRMTDTTRARRFLQLLNGAKARNWSGILLSGGGNDLIEALQSTASDPALRLLRLQTEVGDPQLGPHPFVSDPGWETFRVHLQAVMQDLVAARDRGINQGQPIVLHTYDVPAPRDAAAGLNFGPWLSRALITFAVPQAEWNGVASELFARLHALVTGFPARFANVHVVDTLRTLAPAGNQDPGPTEDWQNEIHPTRAGYRKLAEKWTTVLDAVL
ncbi:MAG TPA: hypothetical protein VF522_22745 [Ramlibacter sp.]|uniref:hypothetical protein n=1 Tax=Ramlibacter sp. TaxID=1917967 RepID=UPI002ED3E77F